MLLEPHSQVWIEEPGYDGARDALRMAGARLVPVPVDGEGLDVAAGIARCPQARAAYVTPSHQYPLGMTMSASRRLQLLDWAQKSGAWIIEDDYDSEYRYESFPVAALQGMDQDSRVIYIGTFSKVLFPALRIGYIVVPKDLAWRFAAVREAMDIFPPTLYQAVLADFLGALRVIGDAALGLLPGTAPLRGLVLGYGGTSRTEILDGVRRLRGLLSAVP